MTVIKTFSSKDLPPLLREIPDPPKKLYYKGDYPSDSHTFLAVVGSRKYSAYGKAVTEKLIQELRGTSVVIVSGLALGIDSIAHRAALKAGLTTVAVPGSGLNEEVLYPSSHQGLARQILKNNGALLSEFEPSFRATRWSFPKRNRIMAGLCHATLIVEAAEKSGTLITARLATEYNREVLTVPGSIFSESSRGPHALIKDGAAPVTSGRDICQELQIEDSKELKEDTSSLSPDEQELLGHLKEPLSKEELIHDSSFSSHKINRLLSLLEIEGRIIQRDGKIYKP